MPGAPGALWPLIERGLNQAPSYVNFQQMLQPVRDSCAADYDCLRQSYYDLMIRLERRFNLPDAIYVCDEIVRIAHERNDLETEAGACMNLNRYYGAIGKKQSAALNLNKALDIYEQTGNQPAVIHTRMTMLEQSLDYRKLEDVLPEMEALLARAVVNRDTQSATYLHIRLLLHCQTLERYDEMAKHIEALEKVPLSDPIRPNEYGTAIHAALGRADLARARKNPEEAKRYYQKTLQLCEAEPSRWLEIHVLQSLAELAQEQRHIALAKSYLDKAEVKAEKLQVHDLLARNYELKADIAEAEKHYADALRYTKKKVFHEKKFKAQSAGFDMQNYYLQLEKDQLTTEKENRELELDLKRHQLRNSLIIMLLLFFLAGGFVLGFVNLRKQKKALDKQNVLIGQQSEALQSLDRLKSRFYANVSHELRTPLTLVLGPLEQMLKYKKLSPEHAGLLETAQHSAAQLLGLVNEILQLGKMETIQPALKPQNTVLRDFVAEIVQTFTPLAESRKVHLSLDYAPDPSWTLSLDRRNTFTILKNLLSNALRFTPTGGRITLSVAQTAEGVRITVCDTGTGIYPGDMPHIFDLYYQSNHPDAKIEGGTGIGLTLSHELAAAMGGRLWAENNPVQGSTFFLTLPASGVQAGKPEPLSGVIRHNGLLPAAAAPALPPAPAPHLLLVEDNPDMLGFLCNLLQNDYRLTLARNGREALDWLEQSAELPELILTDWMMPGLDGPGLIERLRERETWNGIPVIMLTARAACEDRLRIFRIGIDDYLVKPFSPAELLARIANVLRNLEARREWQAIVAAEPRAGDTDSAQTVEVDWLPELMETIRVNIGGPQFNIDQLADLKGIGRSTLYRQIRAKTGMSANQLVQEVRLLQARELLESGQYTSLRALAEAVGFRTPNYLSRLYRERFGESPID